jgi:type IV pilus assembly protein PilV
VSLIEVLVAVLVLSFGMLGVAALQATSVRTNQSATLRSMAVSYAYDIADRMRGNPGQVRGTPGIYDIAAGVATGGSGQAATDLAQWKADLAAGLPSGDGSIAYSAASDQWTISVTWDDTAASRLEASTTKQVQLSVEVF